MTDRERVEALTGAPLAQAADHMTAILGLESHPVAVFLLPAEAAAEPPFASWQRLEHHRYCQALMRARRGAAVLLTGDQLACPAAAAAFGLRPLPEGLVNGKGLAGFGIVQDPATGARMFRDMPHLEPGSIAALGLAPLREAPWAPDVVVVEGTSEQLMWLVLADLNREGGARRTAHSAVLQATCVDATIVPCLEERLNFTLGCYGCREATDIGPSETVLGFPGVLLEPLVERLTALAEKAIPRSRAKGVHAALAAGGGTLPADAPSTEQPSPFEKERLQ